MLADAAQMAIRAVAGAFTIGVQMSAPFIVFGLVFNLGLAILGRLMPQLQVYFVGMPASVGVGLVPAGGAADVDDGPLSRPLLKPN